MNPVKLLDVVALTADLPNHRLRRGQVGTIVEVLAPDVFEVKFSDDAGQTYASLALRADQFMVCTISLRKLHEACKSA